MWDYKKYFRQNFLNLGNIIKKSNMRVDSHPDQFNVINSTRESVIQSTLVNLNNSVDIF